MRGTAALPIPSHVGIRLSDAAQGGCFALFVLSLAESLAGQADWITALLAAPIAAVVLGGLL